MNNNNFKDFKAKADEDEKDGRSQYVVAWLYANNSEPKYEEAAKYYRRSIDNEPNNVDVLLDLAQLLFYKKVKPILEKNHHDEIEVLLKSAYRLTKDNPKKRGRISCLLYQLYKNYDSALSEQYLNEALSQHDPIAENLYGCELIEKNNVKNGHRLLNLAVAHGNAYAAFNIAVLMETGMIPCRTEILIRQNYKKAADLGLVKAYYHLGCLSEQRGDQSSQNLNDQERQYKLAALYFFNAAEKSHYLSATHYASLVIQNLKFKQFSDSQSVEHWFQQGLAGDTPTAHYEYAIYLSQQKKKYDLALDHFVIAQEKEYASSIDFQIGNIYLIKKEYLLALRYFNACMSQEYDDVFPVLYEMILDNRVSNNKDVVKFLKRLTDLARERKENEKLFALAGLYLKKSSVPENKTIATRILTSLDKVGYVGARQILNTLKNTSTKRETPQRDVSRRMSRLFLPITTPRVLTRQNQNLGLELKMSAATPKVRPIANKRAPFAPVPSTKTSDVLVANIRPFDSQFMAHNARKDDALSRQSFVDQSRLCNSSMEITGIAGETTTLNESRVRDSSMEMTSNFGKVLDIVAPTGEADESRLCDSSMDQTSIPGESGVSNETRLCDSSMDQTAIPGDSGSSNETRLCDSSMDESTFVAGSPLNVRDLDEVLSDELDQSITEIRTAGAEAVTKKQHIPNSNRNNTGSAASKQFATEIPHELENDIELGPDTIVIEKMLIYLADGKAIVMTQMATEDTNHSMKVDEGTQELSISDMTPRTTFRHILDLEETPRRRESFNRAVEAVTTPVSVRKGSKRTSSHRGYSKKKTKKVKMMTTRMQVFSDALAAYPIPSNTQLKREPSKLKYYQKEEAEDESIRLDSQALILPIPRPETRALAVPNQLTIQEVTSAFSNVLTQYSSKGSSILALPQNLIGLFRTSVFKLDSAEFALRENVQALEQKYVEKKGKDIPSERSLVGRTRRTTNIDFAKSVTAFTHNSAEDAEVLERFAKRHSLDGNSEPALLDNISSEILYGVLAKDHPLKVKHFYKPLVSVIKSLLEMGQELVTRRNQFVDYLQTIDQHSSGLSTTATYVRSMHESFEKLKESANAQKIHVKKLAIVSERSPDQLSSFLLEGIGSIKAIESGLKHTDNVHHRLQLDSVPSGGVTRSQHDIDFFGESRQPLKNKYLSSAPSTTSSSTIDNTFLCENLQALEEEVVDEYFWCATWLTLAFKSRDWCSYASQAEIDAGKVYTKVQETSKGMTRVLSISSENFGGMLQLFFTDIGMSIRANARKKDYCDYEHLTIVAQHLQMIVNNLFGQYNSLLLLAMRETKQYEESYRDVESKLRQFLTNFSFDEAKMFSLFGDKPRFNLPDPDKVLSITSDNDKVIKTALSPRSKRRPLLTQRPSPKRVRQ